MQESLFAEFPAPSRNQWLAAIEKELKGRGADDIAQETDEGFKLSPVQDAADADAEFSAALADRKAGWASSLDYGADLPADELNRRLDADFRQGLDHADLWCRNAEAWRVVLAILPAEKLNSVSFFANEGLDVPTLTNLPEGAFAGCDPLTLTAVGLADPSKLEVRIRAGRVAAGVRSPLFFGHLWAEAGCNLVDQTAYALSVVLETLRGVSAPANLGLTIGIGRRLLPEIARLRALRLTWAALQANGHAPRCDLKLHARSVCWTLTPEFPHNNLVRLNIQGIAAVLGGADVVNLAPYDFGLLTAGSDHARRMSINLHHMMREESHLGRVSDPAGGSYAVEKLTKEYAERIMKRMAEIEAAGCVQASLLSGRLRTELLASRERALSRILTGETQIVEVNHLRKREAEFQLEEHAGKFYAEESGAAGSVLITPHEIAAKLSQQRAN